MSIDLGRSGRPAPCPAYPVRNRESHRVRERCSSTWTGRDGTGRDGTGRDGTVRDGTRRTGRDGTDGTGGGEEGRRGAPTWRQPAADHRAASGTDSRYRTGRYPETGPETMGGVAAVSRRFRWCYQVTISRRCGINGDHVMFCFTKFGRATRMNVVFNEISGLGVCKINSERYGSIRPPDVGVAPGYPLLMCRGL